MTGSALLDFVIALVVIVGTGVLFFTVIDKVAPDATMNKVSKVAVGVVLTVVVLLALKALLFGGGGAAILSAGGIIYFAIGVIVLLVVLFLVDLALSYVAAPLGEPLIGAIKYLIFAIALIALLVLADNALFGGRYVGKHFGQVPAIVQAT